MKGGAENLKRVTSTDGTSIACWVSGDGPPLVLVHGTTADHTRWMSVQQALGKRFTVYAVDRRGRGESGDELPYALEREFEDVAAIVDSIPGPVNLLGHSHGSICCLEAALLTKNTRKLILYEAPIYTGTTIYPPGVLDRIDALIESGDRDNAVSTFFREVVRAPEHELSLLRASPSWQARVVAAHTIPRELKSNGAYRFSPERFAAFQVPTLLLLGGSSPAFFRDATQLVHRALSNSSIVTMPGQQHTAMNTAPDLFLAEVLRSLRSEPAVAGGEQTSLAGSA